MTTRQTPPDYSQPGGVSRLRATIIACITLDEGACIMCYDCGHVFVDSKPLSDESQPIDNVTLSKALYYHICAIGRKPDRVVKRHGR